MNTTTAGSSAPMIANGSLTISEVLYDVYRLNQERLDTFLQGWLDYGYATETRMPNVAGVAYLAACKANHQLLDFYLGYQDGSQAPPAEASVMSGRAVTVAGPSSAPPSG